MSTFDSVDYFSDQSLVPNPYPYFDYLRSKCPVSRESPYGVMAVTGHKEACTVYKGAEFSACVSVAGPFAGVSFTADGSDDIGELIEAHRAQIPMSEHIVTQDAPDHTRTRGLLSRLLTPKRLKENEDFMWRLADQQLDTFVDRGSCEFLEDYARPFAMLVIADLLGVPEHDHKEFREAMTNETVGALDDDSPSHNPLVWLDDKFAGYIVDRRRDPRDDVLTELAQAKYPDGSTPEVIDVVHLSTFLFSAGMETTTKLLSAGMRVLGERPDLQALLRGDRSLIPTFLEETLRMESPVKSHFRLARKSTTVGDLSIAAGTTMMLLPGACNRDASKFQEPHEFRIDRPNVREHVAFGRGSHSCPGAPLARAEGRISLNRILDRMADIRIADAVHGPNGARSYTYEPTFILRGLTELHLEYTSAG